MALAGTRPWGTVTRMEGSKEHSRVPRSISWRVGKGVDSPRVPCATPQFARTVCGCCLSAAGPTIVAAGAVFKAIVNKNADTRAQSPNHAALARANELPSNIKTCRPKPPSQHAKPTHTTSKHGDSPQPSTHNIVRSGSWAIELDAKSFARGSDYHSQLHFFPHAAKK